MESHNALFFPSSLEWRRWLEQNHGQEKGVWLIHYKKGSDKRSVSLTDAVDEALCFGWIDGKLRSIDGEKYVLRYSPRKAKSVWSKINKEKAERLIEQGRMTRAGLAKIEEAKRNGYWDNAYTNRIMEEIPLT